MGNGAQAAAPGAAPKGGRYGLEIHAPQRSSARGQPRSGPTWENRLYQITGTTQPSGIRGGYCYLYTLTGTDHVGNTDSVKITIKGGDEGR